MYTIEEQLAADTAEKLIEEFDYDPEIKQELITVSETSIQSTITPPDQTEFRRIDVNRREASSKKVSNMVELDLETLFYSLSESGAILSGDPIAAGAAVVALCGIATSKWEKELTIKAGFVYGIGYEEFGKDNQITQSELINRVQEQKSSYQNPPDLEPHQIRAVLDELADLGCIDRDQSDSEESYITLKESCTFDWN